MMMKMPERNKSDGRHYTAEDDEKVQGDLSNRKFLVAPVGLVPGGFTEEEDHQHG